MSSREGVHDRVGLEWLEALMRARLIRVANSVAELPDFIITGRRRGRKQGGDDAGEIASFIRLYISCRFYFSSLCR